MPAGLEKGLLRCCKQDIQKFPIGTDPYMGVTASFWHATTPFSSSAVPPLPPKKWITQNHNSNKENG